MLAGHLAEHLGSALLAQTPGPLSDGGVNHIHAQDESHGNAAGSAGKVYILGTNLCIPCPWLGRSDSGPKSIALQCKQSAQGLGKNTLFTTLYDFKPS